MASPTQPVYLTAEEVAAQLRLSRMAVYRMVERGELPAYRFGRSYRFDPAAFAAYVTAAQVHQGAPTS